MTDPTIAELADQVRAGLDVDEALALEAPGHRWHIGNAVDPTQPCNVHTFPEAREVADRLNWLVAEHVARHNPERILADVAAKRVLLDEVLGWEHHFSDDYHETCPGYLREPGDDRPCRCGRDERVLAVLRHLAQPYQEASRD